MEWVFSYMWGTGSVVWWREGEGSGAGGTGQTKDKNPSCTVGVGYSSVSTDNQIARMLYGRSIENE